MREATREWHRTARCQESRPPIEQFRVVNGVMERKRVVSAA